MKKDKVEGIRRIEKITYKMKGRSTRKKRDQKNRVGKGEKKEWLLSVIDR